MMRQTLSNKTIIITGCSGKFGTKISAHFSSMGAVVVGLDIKSPNYKLKNFHFIKCDITSEKDVSKTLKYLLKKDIQPNV